MRLTPADVHNVAFKKPSIGKRGYDEDEVDAFLDLVEGELSRLIEQNNELTQRLAAYESGSTPPAAAVGLSKRDADEPSQPPADHAAPESGADSQQTGEQPAVAGEQTTPGTEAVVLPSAGQAEQVQQAVAQAPATSSPLADHHMHAARLLGLAEETAQRLTSEAQAHADNTRDSANAESEKLVSDARNQSEQMLSETKNQSEQMVKEATDKAEATTRDSQLKAEAIDREAQRKYTEVMSQLTEQRTNLEKKIDDLRTYEREYRSRLKGWITEQLTQLDESGATTAPASDGGEQK